MMTDEDSLSSALPHSLRPTTSKDVSLLDVLAVICELSYRSSACLAEICLLCFGKKAKSLTRFFFFEIPTIVMFNNSLTGGTEY